MNNSIVSDDPKVVDAEVVHEQTNEPDLKSKLLCADHWLRFVFMALFVGIAFVSSYVIFVLIIIQFLFALVTGNSDPRLKAFGSSLSQYIFQMLSFLTYNTEEKPFPFADCPQAKTEQHVD